MPKKNSRYKKILLWFLIALPVIVAFLYVSGLYYYNHGKISADDTTGKAMTVGVTIPGATTAGQSYTVPGYVRGIYAFSMKVAVALSILMIIFAGYKYMTSKGDSGAINEAKDILFSTLMGAALLMLVVLVANFAGVNANFINPTP